MSSAAKLNAMATTIKNIQALPMPKSLVNKGIALALGSKVKLFGTAGVGLESISSEKVHLRLSNKSKVQNHIGSIHACGMALLAESATGFVVGMSIPDTSVPVIKTMKIDFVKRATGDMEAVATLTPEQIDRLRTLERGELTVPVVITDAKGIEPIKAEMVWAWVPKVRTQKS